MTISRLLDHGVVAAVSDFGLKLDAFRGRLIPFVVQSGNVHDHHGPLSRVMVFQQLFVPGTIMRLTFAEVLSLGVQDLFFVISRTFIIL